MIPPPGRPSVTLLEHFALARLLSTGAWPEAAAQLPRQEDASPGEAPSRRDAETQGHGKAEGADQSRIEVGKVAGLR